MHSLKCLKCSNLWRKSKYLEQNMLGVEMNLYQVSSRVEFDMLEISLLFSVFYFCGNTSIYYL